MNAEFLNTIIRTFGVYVVALLLTRMMGRKVISQMTFFDFVVGVSMGSIAANAMISSRGNAVTSLTALLTLSVLSVVTALIYIKSFRARKLINSEPVTLIENGDIVEENLNQSGLGKKWLEYQLKKQNIKSISEVFYAGMGNNKNLHISKKHSKREDSTESMVLSNYLHSKTYIL